MFFRKLFGQSRTIITKEKAIEIAQSECQKRDWPWRGEVKVLSRFSKWEVYSNSEAKGARTRIIIDKKTGNVIKAGYIKR